MSDIHSETVAYVRDTMLPEREPPGSTTGAVGWMRDNLFSGWFNSILTVLALIFIAWIASVAVPWAWAPLGTPHR